MAIVVGRVETIETIGAANPAQTVMVGKHGPQASAGWSPIVFSVNNQVVSFDGTYPVIASAGDELAVAGTIKPDGILHATAYENLTRAVGRNGKMSPALMYIVNGCLLSWFLFFVWAISFFSQEEKGQALSLIMFVGMAGITFLWWLIRYYDKKATQDANEIADYARQRLSANSK